MCTQAYVTANTYTAQVDSSASESEYKPHSDSSPVNIQVGDLATPLYKHVTTLVPTTTCDGSAILRIAFE